MISAMSDTTPSVRVKNLSNVSNSPSGFRSIPSSSMKASSLSEETSDGRRGMHTGHTVYICAARMGHKSLLSLAHWASIAARGNPSPRCPLKLSACARTMTLLASKSRKYRFPLATSGAMEAFPVLICSLICSSCARASSIVWVTSLATCIILCASSVRVLIFPLTIFFICKRRLATVLFFSKGSTDALILGNWAMRYCAFCT